MERDEGFRRRKRRVLWITGILLGVLALLIGLGLDGVMIPCPFQVLTGWQCPGCGNTRAVLAVLRGEWAKAFSYNPLFLLECLYLMWLYLATARNYVKSGMLRYRPPMPVLELVFLILLAGWGILRNVISLPL